MSMHLRANKTGHQHPRAKLLDEQADDIRLRHHQGETQRRLAREFGVSQPTVFKIVWGVRYNKSR